MLHGAFGSSSTKGKLHNMMVKSAAASQDRKNATTLRAEIGTSLGKHHLYGGTGYRSGVATLLAAHRDKCTISISTRLIPVMKRRDREQGNRLPSQTQLLSLLKIVLLLS